MQALHMAGHMAELREDESSTSSSNELAERLVTDVVNVMVEMQEGIDASSYRPQYHGWYHCSSAWTNPSVPPGTNKWSSHPAVEAAVKAAAIKAAAALTSDRWLWHHRSGTDAAVPAAPTRGAGEEPRGRSAPAVGAGPCARRGASHGPLSARPGDDRAPRPRPPGAAEKSEPKPENSSVPHGGDTSFSQSAWAGTNGSPPASPGATRVEKPRGGVFGGPVVEKTAVKSEALHAVGPAQDAVRADFRAVATQPKYRMGFEEAEVILAEGSAVHSRLSSAAIHRDSPSV
jgi:hypothetical protein